MRMAMSLVVLLGCGDDAATDASVDRDVGGRDATSPVRDGGRDAGAPIGTPRAVAVGYGTHRMTSDDGLAWENHMIVDPGGGDDPNLLRGVGYGDGAWYAVGNQILRSRDGITWTPVEYESRDRGFLSDAAFLDGTWVAAGGNGHRIRSIDGGASWGDDAGYFSGHYRAIAAGNGVFVAVGHTYGDSNVGLSSSTMDGASWTPERTGGDPYGSIAFGNGVFVAVGGSADISISANGVDWDDLAVGGDLGRVEFQNGAFLIGDGSGYFRSTDGRSYTHVDAEPLPDAVTFAFGRYVATTWPGRMLESADLSSWTETIDMPPGITDIELGHF